MDLFSTFTKCFALLPIFFHFSREYFGICSVKCKIPQLRNLCDASFDAASFTTVCGVPEFKGNLFNGCWRLEAPIKPFPQQHSAGQFSASRTKLATRRSNATLIDHAAAFVSLRTWIYRFALSAESSGAQSICTQFLSPVCIKVCQPIAR